MYTKNGEIMTRAIKVGPLMKAFELMEENQKQSRLRGIHTLERGCGFCHFRVEKQALEVLRKLNGKIIPKSKMVRECFFFHIYILFT
jgi:hypothetical protein